MNTLEFGNLNTWVYVNKVGLSLMENLKEAHNQYESIQNSCQEGIVNATIKMGEIYKTAKIELDKENKKATNKVVGEYFGKSEATIRNYIKIADNRQTIIETPVSEILSVRNMLAIIDGRAKQNKDGSVEKKSTTLTTKDQKYVAQIKTLKTENQSLKSKIKELEKELKEANKIKEKISTITGGK